MDKKITYKNIRYGMLVEVLDKNGTDYHAGCKVHFFNKKGVLVGNMYEFLPYDRLRMRVSNNYQGDRSYPRYFYGKNLEKIRMGLFRIFLGLAGRLLRITQPIMD